MTKRSPYSESDARPEICTSERRYLFVYPFEKQRAWYRLPASERQRIMDEHIAVGRRYPEITINTSYSFGLDDQEFVVSFEADEPGAVPRPGAGAARLGVELLHPARHADLHLRVDVGREGPGRAGRGRDGARWRRASSTRCLAAPRGSPSGRRSFPPWRRRERHPVPSRRKTRRGSGRSAPSGRAAHSRATWSGASALPFGHDPCPKSLQLFGDHGIFAHDPVRKVCNFSGSCVRAAHRYRSGRGSGGRRDPPPRRSIDPGRTPFRV